MGSGLQGPAELLHELKGVTNLGASRILLERGPIEGERPVNESAQTPAGDPEYHGTREILWEAGRTTSQG